MPTAEGPVKEGPVKEGPVKEGPEREGPLKAGPGEGAAGEPGQRVGRRLPESALIGLRTAFTEEVAERLPRVLAAARTLSAEDLSLAVRDVHTLGSSAYVVGADEAARIARAAELVLTQQGPAEQFRRLVADLDDQLRSWLP